MLAAVAVLDGLLLAVLTVAAALAAAQLQAQQTLATLEQSTRAAAVLAILMAQTIQPLDTLVVKAALAL
jgi:hypothetical protein